VAGLDQRTGRRAALVTGAASGIGRAIAARLTADGIDVLSVDREPDSDGPGVPHRADLTVAADNQAAVEAARERFGRLDIVVANAGVQHVAPVQDFPLEQWETIVSLLLTSPFLLAKHAWSALADSSCGRFIAIASAHALVASPFKSAYVSAKHGVLGLVKSLALEGAQAGIAATAVCPGYVRTPLVEKQIADQARAHALSEDEVLERVILEPHAVKELIEPEEVAAVVAFLAGSEGRTFTGVPVTMDQGWTAH
jgi:3-hydroxybutyrate dehydrogenase